MFRTLSTMMVGGYLLMAANMHAAAQSDSHAAFDAAKTAMLQQLPDAYLVLFTGDKIASGSCAGMVQWHFVFQGGVNGDGHATTGGYVRRAVTSQCAYESEVVIDEQYRVLPGYYYLRNHGDLSKVKIEWSAALANVKKEHANFQWSGHFTVFSQLAPEWYQRVLYLFHGENADYLVDATTGEVFTPEGAVGAFNISAKNSAGTDPVWWKDFPGDWSGKGVISIDDVEIPCSVIFSNKFQDEHKAIDLSFEADCGDKLHFKQVHTYNLRPDNVTDQGRKGLVLWGVEPFPEEGFEWGYLAGESEKPSFSLNFLSDDRQILYYLETKLRGLEDGKMDMRFEVIEPGPNGVHEITADLKKQVLK